MGTRLLPQSYQCPNRVGEQLRGDKECPFSDVTKSGRVWRKVPESGARSVPLSLTVNRQWFDYVSGVLAATRSLPPSNSNYVVTRHRCPATHNSRNRCFFLKAKSQYPHTLCICLLISQPVDPKLGKACSRFIDSIVLSDWSQTKTTTIATTTTKPVS